MPSDNMKIWDAVAKTDPKHTKPVSFGARKFTSIDAHWQIKRMTEQFGPIGQGWGYAAEHSIERLADGVVLGICDVTIWWLGDHLTPPTQMPTSRPRHSYGPVRGMAPVYEKNRVDDDAAKKCLTDALTKGLSHLGMSADVFLGLFDDNKYVQKTKAEFADAERADVESLAPKNAARDGDGELLSTYAAEVAKKAQKWADDAISSINLSGNAMGAITWARAADAVPEGRKKSPLQWLEDNAPEQFVRVNTAYTNVTGEGLRQ